MEPAESSTSFEIAALFSCYPAGKYSGISKLVDVEVSSIIETTNKLSLSKSSHDFNMTDKWNYPSVGALLKGLLLSHSEMSFPIKKHIVIIEMNKHMPPMIFFQFFWQNLNFSSSILKITFLFSLGFGAHTPVHTWCFLKGFIF